MASGLKYFGIALVAGTVGAAVALLVAPESGEDTRKRLRKGLDRQRKQLTRQGREVLEDASEFLEGQVDAGKKVLEHQVKQSRKAIDRVADEILDQVEAGRKSVSKLVHS